MLMIPQAVILFQHARTKTVEFAKRHPYAVVACIVYAIFVWPLVLFMAIVLVALGASIAIAATLITLAFMPLLLLSMQSLITTGGVSLILSWLATIAARFTLNCKTQKKPSNAEKAASNESASKSNLAEPEPALVQSETPKIGGIWGRIWQRCRGEKTKEIGDNLADRANAIHAILHSDSVPDIRMDSQRSVMVYNQSLNELSEVPISP